MRKYEDASFSPVRAKSFRLKMIRFALENRDPAFVNVKLITESPSWFIVLCLLAGAAYAIVLYRHDKLLPGARLWLLYTMAAFRFLVVSLLAFLLLTPLIRTSLQRVEKPVIIVAQDQSQSILTGADSSFAGQYASGMKSMVGDLERDFEVHTYSFGERVDPDADFVFNQRETDISGMFDDLYLRFLNRNVGAVILATDGLYNRGNNPMYTEDRLRVPVYPVALGDSLVRKDIRLTQVRHNKIAFLGNTIPLRIMLDARQCAGMRSTLTVKKDSAVLFRRDIPVTGNRFHLEVPVYIENATRGINRFDISLSPVDGEITERNNARQVFIEVTEKKQKVLVLYGSPHPDLAALRGVIGASLNYEAEFTRADRFSGDFSEVNLVVLYQLPSVRRPAATLLENLSRSDVSVLHILGGQSSVPAFNQLQTGVVISSASGRLNEVQAAPADDFTLFSIEDGIMDRIRQLPPLKTPFGEYRSVANNYVLLYQQIGAVRTMQPMLVFNQAGGRKSAVLCGEGIWKWRMHEHLATDTDRQTASLLMKIIQYLSIKEVLTPFRVSYRNNYAENEPLRFGAELYDESGELVNEPDVKMVIRNAQGSAFEFNFSRNSKAYQLDAGSLPAGRYTFRAEAKSGSRPHIQRGEFVISPLQVELTETTADHQLLFTLASRSGGQLVYPAGISDLPGILRDREDIRPVIYTEKKLRDLINLKWFFFVLLALLGMEWFLRKRSGGY